MLSIRKKEMKVLSF